MRGVASGPRTSGCSHCFRQFDLPPKKWGVFEGTNPHFWEMGSLVSKNRDGLLRDPKKGLWGGSSISFLVGEIDFKVDFPAESAGSQMRVGVIEGIRPTKNLRFLTDFVLFKR